MAVFGLFDCDLNQRALVNLGFGITDHGSIDLELACFDQSGKPGAR